MKERELREHAMCDVCNQPICKTGVPLFWTVTIARHGIMMDEVGRQDGIADLMGGSARLAQIMGTDSEMTKPMLGPITITVCEACSAKTVSIAQLAFQEEGG